MNKALLLLVLLFVGSCTNEEATRETLESAGYTNIETTGYSFLTCSEEDTFSTGFRAKNPRGQVVEGTVCCGLIAKGCTIRF